MPFIPDKQPSSFIPDEQQTSIGGGGQFRGAGISGSWEPPRGRLAEAGTAVVKTFLDEAKGLTGTYGPVAARMPAGLPAGPGAGIFATTPAFQKHLEQSELAREAVEPIIANIRSAEQKWQPERGGVEGWVINTLAGGGTQLGINLALGAEMRWIGPAINMFAVARQNVLDAGGSGLEANLTGLSEAALEAWGVSRLLKFKAAGKGSLKALISNVRKGLLKEAKGNLKNIGANALKSALVNGLEEVSQGGAEFVWELIPGGRDIPRKSDGSVDWGYIVKSLAEQGAGGALLGALVPGGMGAVETITEGGISQQQRQSTKQPKVYEGPAFRTETGTEIKHEAKTAADVVKYEQEELGNDIKISPEKMKELETRPASDIVWVARDKTTAAEYGVAKEDIGKEPSLEDIKNVVDYSEAVKGGEIIDEMPDGVLVLKPKAVKAEQVEPTTVTPIEKQPVLPEIQKEVDQYDALMQKVQEGNKRAISKLNNLIRGSNRPTYDELLERVYDGDQHAIELIEAGFYQGGRPFGTLPQQVVAPTQLIITEEQVVTPEIKAEEQPKLPRMSRKKALKLGHDIPEILGWDEAQRRDFMQQTVGKPSMKNMTPKEMKTLVTALQEKMKEAGLEYTPPESPVSKLVETLEQTKKPTEVGQIEELNRGKIRKIIHRTKSGGYSFITGLERMERFCESLDGHKEGAFTNEVWQPIKQKDELSTENANNRHKEFLDFAKEQKIDNGKWLSKQKTIKGVRAKLTSFQKIGIYLQSQNKKGMKQLIDGVGFTPNEVITINNSITPEEQKVADWLSNKYEEQWPILQQVAAQAGMDLTKLKKEFKYAPIIRLDSDLETQEDFLSAISDAFKGESIALEKEGIIQKRKPGAYGKIELDAAVQYLHNTNRVERFLQFAPEAKRLSNIFNNREFKEALNTRTYGQGTKLFNKWVKDSIRGSVNDNTTFISKSVSMMRRNGVVYAIAYNIPSSLRQTLSLSNAIAVDPLMMVYTPVNLAKASNPFSYKKLEQFVYDRSLTVKHANFDRDLSIKMNRYAFKMKLKGKRPWSRRAVRWIRWMDRHTRVVAWKSLYDVSMKKFGDETKAVEYADKWIGRTQPMADMKDLPHFFRGGTLEKLLTTFQNQINNNGNFYVYDILGAKKSGEIGYTKAGYRVMFSYVLPAILFGMIGRARLPKTIGEVITDLVTYPIASLVVMGRWINAMIQGWSSGTIAEAGPAELSKLVGAAKRKELAKIIKYAASTIGAFTGRIPAQAIRTTEGAADLYQGKTEDWRRLIYSKKALEEGEKKLKYTGGYINE